jgi:uncharacterized protein (DUF4415 family)
MENGIKKQISIRIDQELLERMKDMVYWNPGWTLNDLIEITLRETIYSMERCEKRPSIKLKPGRKVT